MVKCYMADWLIWQTDYGELAYGKLGNGETTSFHSFDNLSFTQAIEHVKLSYFINGRILSLQGKKRIRYQIFPDIRFNFIFLHLFMKRLSNTFRHSRVSQTEENGSSTAIPLQTPPPPVEFKK